MKVNLFNLLFHRKDRQLSFEGQLIKYNIDLSTLVGSAQNICKVRGCSKIAEGYFCKNHLDIATFGTMYYCLKCQELISIENHRYDKLLIKYKKDCLLCRSWQATS